MLRAFLERATHRSSFRRSLPRQVGGAPIYVSGSAGLKYLFRRMDHIDPVLCDLACEFVRPGSVVWDIGANVGLFAFAAAHLAGTAGKVFAFEADTWLVQLLRQSARVQPPTSASVQIVPTAIANACGLRSFNISVRSRASSSLAGYGYQSATGGVAEQQTILSVTLDWLAERLPPPDVIKIDVEGAEVEVLSGARALLERCKPIVLCEVSSERSPDVSHILQSVGYRLYDGEQRTSSRTELSSAPWTTVAIGA